MKAFLDSIDHYLDGLEHIAPGACPGCPECLPVEVSEPCDNPECYAPSEPCEACQQKAIEDPPEDWYDYANEPSFSWSQCDSCGSTFGGDRHPAHAFPEDETSDYLHLSICTDCLLFHANGDLPETWHRTPREARETDYDPRMVPWLGKAL